MPERIQLRRTKGWRKPEGAVVVSRPTKWGNPFMIGPIVSAYPSLTVEQCASFVVNQFKFDGRERLGYPSVDDIRRELAGRDLACWCPLDQPCHADELLRIANLGDPAGTSPPTGSPIPQPESLVDVHLPEGA